MANLGRFGLVAATSALMETLAGNFKVALLCLIDHELFHTTLYFHNYLGVVTTFLGFSGHVLLQYIRALMEQDQAEEEDEKDLATIPEGEEGEERMLELKEHSADTGRARAESTASSRGARRSRVDSMEIPQMMSGGETGLAAELVSVQMGRKSLKLTKPDKLFTIEEDVEVERPRAATWAAGQLESRSNQHSWLGKRLGVEVSPLWQAPDWLSSSITSTDSKFRDDWGEEALAVLEQDAQFRQDTQRLMPSNGATRGGKSCSDQESNRSRIWTVG
jgi:hypothetical protein